MGHIAKWHMAPANIIEAFAKGLSRIPADYAVIWQYLSDSEPPPGLPSHIKLLKWMPQQQLLGES